MENLFCEIDITVPVLVPGRRAFITLLAATMASIDTWAASYPTKTIRLVIPTPPGSGADILARTLSEPLVASLGQSVIVESRSGASGTIAAALASQSAADGYTLLLTYGIQALTPLAYKRLPYEPFTGFTPISALTRVALVAVVPPALGVDTMADFVALARRSAGKLNFASTGKGALNHLVAESLRIDTGIDLVHVPYKGGAPAIQAVAANEAQLYFSSYAGVKPLIDAGKLRVIATTGGSRLPQLPAVPTVREAGFPGVEAYDWYGVLGPAALPEDVRAALNAALVDALKRPNVAARLVDLGYEIVGSTPAEFAKLISDDHSRWGRRIAQANITFDE